VLNVGRALDNEIVLEDGTVSAHHAQLRWEDGRWIVFDRESRNGTYVSYSGAPQDERPITRNALREGFTVRFGPARFYLDHDPDAA
jgi:pSer/pThr/pTyr-binding forkhead associated (FHA) protein